MQHWDLSDAAIATEKLHDRESGSDAPRVPTKRPGKPQVLFSTPECRAVVLTLAAGGSIGDHKVQERAVIQVVSGSVSFTTDSGSVDAPAGTLINFEPAESHSVAAHEDSMLLLILAPWPANRLAHDAEHLPKNAAAEPEEG